MTTGRKTGGRVRGVPNKTAQKRAEAIADERKATGRKLGVDVMSEAMNYFRGMAAQHQPVLPDGRPNPKADPKLFEKYLEKAADIAKDLAPYETPKLQSTTLRGSGQGGEIVHRVEIEYV